MQNARDVLTPDALTMLQVIGLTKSLGRKLDVGDESADYRGFTTLIHLPAQLCIVPPEFAQAS